MKGGKKNQTRRERLKSALYIRLKKRKTFLKLELFVFGKCCIVPKNVKGGPFGFINKQSVAKYKKTRRGDPFETLKNFGKKSHSAEKNPKGGPLVCFLGSSTALEVRSPIGSSYSTSLKIVHRAQKVSTTHTLTKKK